MSDARYSNHTTYLGCSHPWCLAALGSARPSGRTRPRFARGLAAGGRTPSGRTPMNTLVLADLLDTVQLSGHAFNVSAELRGHVECVCATRSSAEDQLSVALLLDADLDLLAVHAGHLEFLAYLGADRFGVIWSANGHANFPLSAVLKFLPVVAGLCIAHCLSQIWALNWSAS